MRSALVLIFLLPAICSAGVAEDILGSSRSDSVMRGVMMYEWEHGSQDCAICCWWALYYAGEGDWQGALDFGRLAWLLASSDLNRAAIAFAYWLWLGYEQDGIGVPDLGDIPAG